MPTWIEIAGYVPSILAASTFCMKTMLPLRCFAIASSVAFIVYGYFHGVYPVLILHLFLLPMNVLRLRQLRKLVKDVREAAENDCSLECLIPRMKKTHYGKGASIFVKGDAADEMLYIRGGRIGLSDIEGAPGSKVIEPGTVIGEIGIFAPERKRTASASAEDDADVYTINEGDLVQLYYQDPRFAYYLVKLITRRMIENQAIPDLPR